MNKAEFIKKYGEEEYAKRQERIRTWKSLHSERIQAHTKKWNHKDGVNYEKAMNYQMNGLPHAKGLIRWKHGKCYFPYKQIIAPDSVLHHEWIPETADYKGVALVEKDQHLHGFIDVIQILEGGITLLTEVEIRGGQEQQ